MELGDLPEWNLADLYASPDAPEFARDLDRAREDAKAFARRYRGAIAELGAEDGKALAEAITAYEALADLIGRLGAFAMLCHAGNASDPVITKFFGDTRAAINDLTTELLFFELELNRIDDQAMDAAMAEPALAHFRPWLENVRKERPYQLGDETEKLFHEKAMTASSAWVRLFDQTMAELKFEIDGEMLSLEPTLNRMLSPEEEVREGAAKALSATLEQNLPLFAHITNTLAKDKEIADRWRGFADIADSRHLANQVEREVVDALVDAVTKAYPRLSHRYYALKAKWFGKDQLNHWDRNAPLPDAPERVIAWDEARSLVLDAYSGFTPKMASIADDFFTNDWIDAPVREGKAPGAFAHPTTPSAHPYVLLNYQGRPRDVMTLAHELGHGVHQVLAAPHGALMAPTPLTVAETASVFGEMLTFRKLLAGAGDPRERTALLASKVEDMLNTVVRQTAFYSFERAVHTERRDGELTPARLGEIWLQIQGESLGPAIRLGPGYETFWAYVPHFIHAPFYVYAYAFGDCLVNSLYALYENAEEGFADKYLDMLAAGGTAKHRELLAPFGLDASDPSFWDAGLAMIADMIDELEADG
ncbi:MAG: M3 family oligoendopeptidase [Rhizobiales bacterium]|nr:M3 family oligoendopeptidase [Hyphomicrobiales bacterium]